jgi:hypothetical protein
MLFSDAASAVGAQYCVLVGLYGKGMLDMLAGHVLSSVPPGFFLISCAFDEK